jgi:hypothetical protein
MYAKKNVAPETSLTASTWFVQDIYKKRKVVPEISTITSAWPVQPIYATKNLLQKLLLRPPRGLQHYDQEGKICLRDFLDCLHVAYPGYIRDEKLAPEISLQTTHLFSTPCIRRKMLL